LLATTPTEEEKKGAKAEYPNEEFSNVALGWAGDLCVYRRIHMYL
jgi:hypothetical protein